MPLFSILYCCSSQAVFHSSPMCGGLCPRTDPTAVTSDLTPCGGCSAPESIAIVLESTEQKPQENAFKIEVRIERF